MRFTVNYPVGAHTQVFFFLRSTDWGFVSTFARERERVKWVLVTREDGIVCVFFFGWMYILVNAFGILKTNFLIYINLCISVTFKTIIMYINVLVSLFCCR